jgi:hypothetical protein
MSHLGPDVVTAIKSIQSEADLEAADDRVKEALRTYKIDDPDEVPEVAAVFYRTDEHSPHEA